MIARHRDPGLYLTTRELNVMLIATAAGAISLVAGVTVTFIAALLVLAVLTYRSIRRARAASRRG